MVNPNCLCKIEDREDLETQREWLKRVMCMYHWMQTEYYRAKLHKFIDGICVDCGREEALATNECNK